MVSADIALIERVLENLIDNALRYTPENGFIYLELAEQNSGVEVSVSDTGIGLSKEDLPFIFERYYRVQSSQDMTAPENEKRTGLDLAIVKRILE